MQDFFAQLNNREVALLIWLYIFVVSVVYHHDTRKALSPVLRQLFFSKVTLILIAMLAYISLNIWVLHVIGLWEPWMLKDTIFWLFGPVAVTFINLNRVIESDHYFRDWVLGNFRVAIVLAFIVNLYVFNLLVELLLVPLMALLAALSAVAGTKAEFAPVKKVLNWPWALIGFGFLTYAIVQMVTNFHDFATLKNLVDFALPIALTILLIPFIYSFALYATYELLFVRLDILCKAKDSSITSYAKRRIIKTCLFRLNSVKNFSRNYAVPLSWAESSAEIDRVIAEFTSNKGQRNDSWNWS